MPNIHRKKILCVYMVVIFFGNILSVRADSIIVNQSVNTGTSTPPVPEIPSVPAVVPAQPSVGAHIFVLDGRVALLDKSAEILFNSLDIIEGDNYILLKWNSAIKSKSKISWGRFVDTEKGTILESYFGKEHNVLIEGLEPMRKYIVNIFSVGEDNKSISVGLIVTTRSIDLVTAPPNVLDIKTSTIAPTKIRLSWVIPPIINFKGVKVIRSNSFFPRNIDEGKIIYTGRGTSIIDSFDKDTNNFYTIFLENKDGILSSGASISFTDKDLSLIPSEVKIVPIEKMALITTDGLSVFQNGKKVHSEDGVFVVDKNNYIKLVLRNKKIAEYIKTVILVMTSTDGKQNKFILRYDDLIGQYETVIKPSTLSGSYDVLMQFFDRSDYVVGTSDFSLRVEEEVSIFVWIIALIIKIFDSIALSFVTIFQHIQDIIKIIYNIIIR